MLDLESAIKHCEEVAEKNEKKASWFWGKEGNPNYESCVECAKEHRQLARWLKELKAYRDKSQESECENCDDILERIYAEREE